MKNVQTGHTLCDPRVPLQLRNCGVPCSLLSPSLCLPKTKALSIKWVSRSVSWCLKTPPSKWKPTKTLAETILKGMGELHLNIKVDILKRTYGVELIVGAPQVAYRETITKPVEDGYTHKKQSGGSGQYGKIDYRIRPGEPGTGFSFKSTVVGGNVPKEFWPAIQKGFGSTMTQGPGWLPCWTSKSNCSTAIPRGGLLGDCV